MSLINEGYRFTRGSTCICWCMVFGQTGWYGWTSGMGGWVGWQKLITFLAKSLDIRGECINDGLELASSFCISYEAKFFTNEAGKTSPRFSENIFWF